jgi:glycosyltransferase involved in cell wall biosynthesis
MEAAKTGLFLITQEVDEKSLVLGFFVSWIRALARVWPGSIYVYCWSFNRETILPKNVIVRELPSGKWRRTWALLKASWQFRDQVNRIFVHMISPVIVAVGWFWKLLNWKIVLWYAHGGIPWELRVSEKIADRLLTPSVDSLRLHSKKIRVTGHGIDVTAISLEGRKRLPLLLCVGRITPRKDQVGFVDLCAKIHQQHPALLFKAEIIGKPLVKGDDLYLEALKKNIEEKGLSHIVEIKGPVFGPDLRRAYQEAALCINPSKTGSLDKVVLEALANETPVITVGHSYEGLEAVCMVESLEDPCVVERAILALESPQAVPVGRRSVEKKASLDTLAHRIVTEIL